MKYCIRYNKNFPYLEEVDEIIIDHAPFDIVYKKFQFLIEKQLTNKRIIYVFSRSDMGHLEQEDIMTLIKIKEQFPYLSICLPSYNEKCSLLKDNNVDFFFTKIANNWESFWCILEEGVSDIYIGEDLCFELDKIKKVAEEYGIKIRTFACINQTKIKKDNFIKGFFVRPEDVNFLEQYIDVLEFWCDEKKGPTYYKIYAKDKRWFGQLNEIIIGLNSNIDNRSILPSFIEHRYKCGRSCLKGSNCNICNNIAELSQVLNEKELYFKVQK